MHEQWQRSGPRRQCLAVPLALGLVLGLAAARAATPVAAPPPAPAKRVQVVAYVNLVSGCQKETEEVLRTLAREYGDRLALEIVDFGGAGKERWRRDGMHCMGIRLDGSTRAEVTTKGVRLTVCFEMPAGYQWTHEELVLAVRQRLDGIQETDRKPPVVATASTEQETTLLIGGQPVLRLPDRQAMETAAGVLRQTATDRALTREDFGYGVDAGRIQLLVRNRAFLEITQEAVKRSGERASDLARHCCEAVAEAYPALTRPFPGQVPPGRR